MEVTVPSFDKSITDSYLPATEVKRMAMQNPILASDFIAIRVTAMTVRVDFGLVVLISFKGRFASSGPLLHKVLCFRPLSLLTSAQYIELIIGYGAHWQTIGKKGGGGLLFWGWVAWFDNQHSLPEHLTLVLVRKANS